VLLRGPGAGPRFRNVAHALITGANRGLGFETAKELASRGWNVVVAGRDLEAASDAARTVGARARAVRLDVADPEAPARALAELGDVPVFDALVNNAGASFDGFDASVAARTLETNFRGAVRVTETFRPRLSSTANVVMVSSGMGELGHVSDTLRRRLLDPLLTFEMLEELVQDFIARVQAGGELGGWPRNAYSVSKVALNAFVRLLAPDLPSGQRVNAVCPGWVRTRMGGAAASRSVEKGAAGIVWAATLREGGPNGGFFRDAKPIAW
jgi:NAD(P)-dependent dehydrogenase (short-subunit alcohol dehydrogenase family)